MTNPNLLQIYVGSGILRLSNTVDEYGHTISDDIRNSAKELISSTLTEDGYGSGFLYVGLDNHRWFTVASDEGYSAISSDVNTSYEKFIEDQYDELRLSYSFCFLGVGDTKELETLLLRVKVVPVSRMTAVDVCPLSIMKFYFYCQARGFQNTKPILADLKDSTNFISPETVSIFRGGTSCNLPFSELSDFLGGLQGRAYVDFFIDNPNLSNADILSKYEIPSVIDLALSNYNKLFSVAGYGRNIDSTCVKFEVVPSEHGRDLVSWLYPNKDLRDYFLSNSITLPDRIRLFISSRRHPDFAEVMSEVSGMSIVRRYKTDWVGGVFLRR